MANKGILMPEDCRYTPQGLWIRAAGGERIEAGLGARAIETIGKPVYLEFLCGPSLLKAGKPFALVESAKAVIELALPFDILISEFNKNLEERPALLAGQDPAPWLIAGSIEGFNRDMPLWQGLLDHSSFAALPRLGL